MDEMDHLWAFIELNVAPITINAPHHVDYEYHVGRICYKKRIDRDTGEVTRSETLRVKPKRAYVSPHQHIRIFNALTEKPLTHIERSVFLQLALLMSWNEQIVELDNAPVGLKRLADHMSMDKRNFTRIIERLEELACVERVKKGKSICVKIKKQVAQKGSMYEQ
jgi:hypothetical protein